MLYFYLTIRGNIKSIKKKGRFSMPRDRRSNHINDSKIYHIIVKGINGQELFFDNSDRLKFLRELKNTQKVFEYEVYAYVLMTNHVHLMIYDKNDNLSEIMHRICTIYAMYFNNKYERIGHLFQNRFKSKCVNTEGYLLTLQKYIHKNPEKDGIDKMERYRWSSYQEYLAKEKITNTKFILEIFDKDKITARRKFIQYNHSITVQNPAEFEMREYLTDEEAIMLIKDKMKAENLMLVQNYNRKTKEEYIRKIFESMGISKKQISRILGINIRTVQRAITGK